MRKLLSLLLRRRPAPAPLTLDDMVGEKYRIWNLAAKAQCLRDLAVCEALTRKMARRFAHMLTVADNVGQLHSHLLRCRCDLLASRYPIAE